MEYTRRVIDQQLPERREFVTKAMNKLMGDVTWTMSTKNRERFTQNVSSFRRELASENVVLVPVRVY
ncbi:hypothetical protein BCR43DRAFT_492933 [Syncephalastrum racemosum]|uniref:Uncharacterized protein n=1 Tax=Syncephalastrum racemosum TaxID=13706 RepID=A0A1X2H9T3_SYNRA|nr:hypothetical protein BCR43DRAFT_492933 [Syncephalastrum racemosum]